MNKVTVFGGLGNQMFQFALAISMDSSGIPTKISVNEYIFHEHYQGFELIKAFDIPVSFEDRFKVVYVSKFLRPLFVYSKMKSISRFIESLFRINHKVYLEKQEFEYDEAIFNLRDSYLVGGWKAISYFEGHRNLIQEVFNFKKPSDDINLALSKKIRGCNSVALHVRRGNYAYPEVNESRILLDTTSYYELAIRYLKKRVKKPMFFVFSDDVEWVKEKFIGDEFCIVSHNTGLNSYFDMYLMSICDHFIIANSSFSWWPAWLSENVDKIVVSPNTWTNGDLTKSIIPEDWVVIPVDTYDLEMAQL